MHSIFVAAAWAAQLFVMIPPAGQQVNGLRSTVYSARSEPPRALLVVLEDRTRADGQWTGQVGSVQLDSEFQVCRIDVNSGYGQRLVRTYRARSFPYAMITDEQGAIVQRGSSIVSTKDGQEGQDVAARARASEPTLLAARLPQSLPAVELASQPDLQFSAEAAFDPTSVEEAQQRARQHHRMLVAFVTTKACHYCIKMKREALQDPGLRSKVQQDFVSACIDADQCADWAEEHSIRMYPTVLVLTSQGQLVDRIEGYATADQLVARLDQATAQLISQR